MKAASEPQTKVADEVWIAAALLHREHPDREDFSIAEIVERARKEASALGLRGSVHVHVVQHCVANRRPNPGRYRMLLETGKSRRRLFRPGDPFHPAREGAKTAPAREDIPARYRDLIDWYNREHVRTSASSTRPDRLLALRGSGRAVWADERADDYVRRLREGWE